MDAKLEQKLQWLIREVGTRDIGTKDHLLRLCERVFQAGYDEGYDEGWRDVTSTTVRGVYESWSR